MTKLLIKGILALDLVVGAVLRPAARAVLWATGKRPPVLGARLFVAGWVIYWAVDLAKLVHGLVTLDGVELRVRVMVTIMEAVIFLFRFLIWTIPLLVALGRDLAAVRSIENGRLLIDPDLIVKGMRSVLVVILVLTASDHPVPIILGLDATSHLSVSLGLYLIYEKKPPSTLRSTARAKLAAARARLAGIQWAPAPAPTPI